LANLLNEAACWRANKKSVGMQELEEARDKVRWGRERRSLAMTDEDKKFTAWHEAGHALVNVILQHTHPLHKVTIIPRGQSLGSTMSLQKTDILNRRRKEMLDMIAVMMAGVSPRKFGRYLQRRRRGHPAGDEHGARDGDAVGHERPLGHDSIR
jgi:cell division protease FtsH